VSEMQKRPDIHKSFSGLTLATQEDQNGGMEWKIRLAKAGMAGGSILIGFFVVYLVWTASFTWRREYPFLAPWLAMLDLAGALGGVWAGGKIYNWGADQIDPTS
jgi:hypothetical protein